MTTEYKISVICEESVFGYKHELETLLLQYPGILADIVKGNQVVLTGPVKIKDHWYEVKISCPYFPHLKAMQCQVQISHEMLSLVSEMAGVNTEWSIAEFIEQLPALIKEAPKTYEISAPLYTGRDVAVYREIVALYAPEAYRIQMTANHSRVRFSHFADYSEQHFIELELPSLRIQEHSLPDCVPWQELFQKCPDITAMIAQFRKYLDELQPFYNSFIEIDELCHVVQPLKPTSKHTWRIFMLRERIFLKFIITDPFAPISSMILHIIGPTQDVEQLRQTYSAGLRNWDSEMDVHKNLLRIFDLCFFPMPPQLSERNDELSVAESEENECNICYCYLLENGEIPLVSCDNTHCSLIFHATCLKEWFKTLTDGKVFLEVCFGACPFCKAKMSTSFAELLEK